jgi:hypothetical protein
MSASLRAESGHSEKFQKDKAFNLFVKIYDPKYPKATLCLQKDRKRFLNAETFLAGFDGILQIPLRRMFHSPTGQWTAIRATTG